MAGTIKAADGSYLFNSKQFEYSKDNLGRPVLNLKDGQVSGDGGGDFKADGTVPMTGNLYMNGNNIMDVKSISNTDSGTAIESEVSLNNHKFTDLLDTLLTHKMPLSRNMWSLFYQRLPLQIMIRCWEL